MDHPNIARVFDGGVTAEGRPFLVMEYVDGVPITEFCRRARLTIPARLDLALAVCDAVRHAHQKGVIHRDLKPSNVLVAGVGGAAAPKVIDFGLAKAVGGRLTDRTTDTVPGAVLGTPAYMSPEQAGASPGDIDTRADVYAVGVLLYELLTGTTPIPEEVVRSAPLFEVLRKVQEEETEPPSRWVARLPVDAAPPGGPAELARALRGDLDWIVLKATAKRRDDRYESPAALADDLRRYLTHRPVAAGPPGRWYRARKFVRRNRAAVAAAAVLLATGGAATLGGFYVRGVERHAEGEVAAAQADAGIAGELADNWQSSTAWYQHLARFGQISHWLGASTGPPAAAGKDPVRLPRADLDRLRRAMLEDALVLTETTRPIPHDPRLSIALLVEANARTSAARAFAELGRPARGIHCFPDLSVA